MAATRDMFVDEFGNVVPKLSINGALSAGVPGEPAALVWLAENYGSLPLTTTLQPTIDAAKNGFPRRVELIGVKNPMWTGISV